ncbi:RimK family alpha-L-glutamate ligase [Thalassotalea sp. PP2-459]|uniref:ATP-grasp domain-containing protein n=1 Tax=Thalassotalea sp. PP2-459 TaxID=1742724 RepID=UPI0020C9FED8|nr:hypothetical protein [Thalassotalea sp. PP2-459]
MIMRKCAFLSMDSLDDFESYDHLVEPHLNALGWQLDTISWRKKQVNWSDYEAVIIRTPWDYQQDEQAFLNVLAEIEQSSAHLENPLEIVRWNIDKIYLQSLELLGATLVPTLWHSRLAEQSLTEQMVDDFFAHFSCAQLIIKPRISANADNTFWLDRDSAKARLIQLNKTFSNRDFMVQPFMEHILNEGEYSLFYFNGQYSHAILKTPKEHDFRVQEEFGSRLTQITPEPALLKAAQTCMAAIDKLHVMPLYARVDFVRHQHGFALMEAELIEPSLYFNMDQQAAKRFADAFVERMHQLTL